PEAGVPPPLIAEGLRACRPLPHRLEPVREVGGVLWINDSKATNIAATTVAVLAMERPFVLLLGGRHKGEPYTSLAPLLAPRCRLVIAYGEAGPLVEKDLGEKVPLERGTTFEDVIEGGRRSPGDRVCADGLPSVAPLGMAAARHHRCAVARAAAALHACHHTDDQWCPSLGEPRCPDAAAVRAGQVRGGCVVRNARREERRSTSQLSARRAAVRRHSPPRDRTDLP